MHTHISFKNDRVLGRGRACVQCTCVTGQQCRTKSNFWELILFCCGFWGPASGSQDCEADALPMESNCQILNYLSSGEHFGKQAMSKLISHMK